MSDRRYLLSIKELTEGTWNTQLAEVAVTKLDRERLGKLEACKQGRVYAQKLGAGLLLQLGLQEFYNRQKRADAYSTEAEIVEKGISIFSLSQVIEYLGKPVEAKYIYGLNGKPGFAEIPLCFNLSHSRDYIFCVFSDKEVGVDIQYKKASFRERLVERYFTESEREIWNSCSTPEEQVELFYRMWSRKEAYGKLIGAGIAASIGKDTIDDVKTDSPSVSWEEFDLLTDYQITVCKQIEERL